ncbi:MAG: hypothetical protein Q7S33_01785 [Nanoarchaeota archaeon]|nr:hypothetical protein [Nanoarchaeota archaeon]
MLPQLHVLLGFIFSYILVYFFNFSISAGIIVFLAAVFIDLDHYFRYIIKTKNFNFIKFMKLSYIEGKKLRNLSKNEKLQYKMPHFLFHGIEFFLIILILSFFNSIFFWILIGITFHMILDFIDMYYHKDPFSVKLSQIYVFIKNKNKKELKL